MMFISSKQKLVGAWHATALAMLVTAGASHALGAQSRPDSITGAPFPYAIPEAVGVQSADVESLARDVRGWVEGDHIVGGELLIVKDRHIIFHEAWGWSDRELEIPLERNSIYRIRSMTKPFVGTAVLMLVEKGRLSLDDRVADILPSFDNERSGAITVRQLLAHNTGHRQGAYPPGYWETGNLRDAVDLIGEMGAPNAPGSGYRYSDLNSATLGAIVVELTGMRVEEYLADHIFAPLELEDTHTFFEPGVSWASRMNSTYSRREEGWGKYWDNTMPQQTPFFRASGGIYTTVFDYAKWLTVFMDRGAYDGGRLLSEETVVEALSASESERYGYHWEVYRAAGAGDDLPAFGHSGSDGTMAMAIPRHDVMVLYFTQSRGQQTIMLYENKVLMLFEP